MTPFIKKITKIIDEITTYFMTRNKSNFDLTINIKNLDSKIYMVFSLKNFLITKSELRELENSLKIPRQEDADEFYWQLNGTSELEREFDLVGMMVDDYKIEFKNGEFILTLIRNI